METKDLSEEPLAQYSKPLDFEQVWQMFQETDKILTEKFQETDLQFKETDKKFQETDKKIKELTALFTSQWGKLVESLVEGDLIKHGYTLRTYRFILNSLRFDQFHFINRFV